MTNRMPAPMSISKSFGRPGLESGMSWGRESSLSRMLERSSGFNDAFDHPTPTSVSHLALLSTSASSFTSDNGDRLSRLEENFCQGYHCCGHELADLHRLLEHFEEHHALSSSPATSVVSGSGKDSLANMIGSPRNMNLAELKRKALNIQNRTSRAPSTSSSLSTAAPTTSTSQAMAIPSDGSFHMDMDDVEMEMDQPESTPMSGTALDMPSTSAFGKGLAALNSQRSNQSTFVNRRSTSPSSISSADMSAPTTPILDSDMDDGASDWDASASTTSLAEIAGPGIECVTPSMLYPSHMNNFQSPSSSQRTSPEVEVDPEEEEAEGVEDRDAAEPRIIMGTDPTMKHLNARGRTLVAPPPTLPSGRTWVAPAAKPFKCPVPGCDKAYKQQNGLKYHRLHGNCNNRLGHRADGGDDADGRETLEEKPYGCYVGAACGKRYKNMNGLRYHYQHSGPHGQIGLEMLSKGTHPAPLLPPKGSRGGSAASSRANSPAPLSKFSLSLNLSSAPPSPAGIRSPQNSAPGTPTGAAPPSTASGTFPGLPLQLTGN